MWYDVVYDEQDDTWAVVQETLGLHVIVEDGLSEKDARQLQTAELASLGHPGDPCVKCDDTGFIPRLAYVAQGQHYGNQASSPCPVCNGRPLMGSKGFLTALERSAAGDAVRTGSVGDGYVEQFIESLETEK